ncbi:hypothetical protein OGAPHI_005195 [Ogataea philodendri]|uniref:YjgF-like protein n=1 Tax=Ogataea philodendri TaxID=1378263 RepID=A0A9P8P2T3_9ASCO|nr:uncharacterized protein OGAPHI_005195 [Ogataea philodendri]KAH3663792.1 hypothetical protein OGAPHI_005195 [Ogataea philodendri]
MSRASKITLGVTSLLCAATTVGVYFFAEEENDDAERLERRRERELNAKQKANALDFEAQKELRSKLEADQPLSGEIVQGVESKIANLATFARLARKPVYTAQFHRMSSTITPVISKNAPPAAAAYSHAVKANGFIYVSGQIPFTPEGKRLEGTFQEKSEQVIKNALAIVKDSGSSVEKVVKVTVFLTDMSKFAEFNEVYVKYFGEYKPARSCIGVKELPLGLEVEMELIAVEN